MSAALAIAIDLAVRPTCVALALSRATFYRYRKPRPCPLAIERCPSVRALVPMERRTVLDLLTSERFCVLWEENSFRRSASMLAQTLVAVSICYAAMASLALQVLILGFPELLLIVVAASLVMGRWTGIRLREYWRFRRLLVEPAQ